MLGIEFYCLLGEATQTHNTFNPNAIISFITGAGGAIVISYLWIKSLKDDKERLLDRIEILEERCNTTADKAISALTECNLHLARNSTSLELLSSTIKDDGALTREKIDILIDEIKKSNHYGES